MEKIKNKILNNFEKELKTELEFLRKKGFIVTPEDKILKYDLFKNNFYEVDLQDFYKIIASDVPNYWNFKLNHIEIIVNKYVFNAAEVNVLPVVDESVINQYVYYTNSKKWLDDPENIIGKRTLNKILKENNSRKKTNFIFKLESVDSQAQLLINNNIFIDKNGRLFKFNNDLDSFEVVTNSDLNTLFYNNLPEVDKKTSSIIKTTIYNTVQESLTYGEYRTRLTYASDIPFKYNEQQLQEQNLINNKDSYKKIKSIIKNFE